MNETFFLKLGGSLITDKSRANTPKLELISRIAGEIADFHSSNPDIKLLIGHGSGSFGHHAASKHDTYNGVKGKEAWQGFFEVWYRAKTLNNIVTKALHDAGLPVISFSMTTSASVSTHIIQKLAIGPMQTAIDNDGIPLVYGDVVFDQVLGGTILSTEDIFTFLAKRFTPTRILLAGIEDGVFTDYPGKQELIQNINPENYKNFREEITGSIDPDVTGGMAGKVENMLSLAADLPKTSIQIFSGTMPGSVKAVLEGAFSGTIISNIS
jgi:isopentenyl phosphate kinase